MDHQKETESNTLFDQLGLQVAQGSVDVGKTYPLFGMITKVIEEASGELLVQLNFSVTAKLKISDAQRIEMIKERLFETGIFVCTVVATQPCVEVECLTVIFGRRRTQYDA